MTDLLPTLTITALLAFCAWREYLGFQERDRLTDRLMAKDLPEYKDNAAKQEPNLPEPEDDGTVDLEEAREELDDYDRAN
jgi:hypothetical protein